MTALGVIKSADLLGETAINRAINNEGLNEKELGALRVCANALSKHFRGI